MEMQPHVCLIAIWLLKMHYIYSLLILVGMLPDLCFSLYGQYQEIFNWFNHIANN